MVARVSAVAYGLEFEGAEVAGVSAQGAVEAELGSARHNLPGGESEPIDDGLGDDFGGEG